MIIRILLVLSKLIISFHLGFAWLMAFFLMLSGDSISDRYAVLFISTYTFPAILYLIVSFIQNIKGSTNYSKSYATIIGYLAFTYFSISIWSTFFSSLNMEFVIWLFSIEAFLALFIALYDGRLLLKFLVKKDRGSN